MTDFSFHPGVARWFESRFGLATEPQRLGWPVIQSGRHTLISAPTGSGKTLAAFLAALDQLFREGLERELPDETRVLYVSPLKALSNDIRKNLQEPLAGIRAALVATEGRDVEVRAEVRTGDTPAAKRQALARKPPHILVTTPESFYLLLTSASGRRMLRTVRTLIVDEIHALVSNRRGSHLALSMERLAALVQRPLQRIGLSATQKPIEEVARFLVGAQSVNKDGSAACAIINTGHRRALDLGVELPGSPLEAVMSLEVWQEVYQRLAELIQAHCTTLVFVNTRRLAERVTHHLCELLGKDKVTSHHGSLSAKLRLDAEDRLKSGELKALVATASLELGIDIGSVDLVCQLGSARSIVTLLQRVGRADHRLGGLPKGRVFPLTRDELVECAAVLRCIRRGELDALEVPEKPLDVLAQQIVACAASEEWPEEKLFQMVRSAWPYRSVTRAEFDEVVRMLAEGFSTRRGRRAALIHHDAVNHRIRARRGAGLIAMTSGGAIPDNADYRVVLEPSETFIGTVNEDFAIESMAGDIFQLGNASWRIVRVNSGMVRVEDAHGQPPGIPFWLGEAPARSAELSKAVSELRSDIERRLTDGGEGAPEDRRKQIVDTPSLLPFGSGEGQDEGLPLVLSQAHSDSQTSPSPRPSLPLAVERENHGTVHADPGRAAVVARWLEEETGLSHAAALQLAEYFSAAHKALGVLPSQRKLVMERFFDESGGMQLVIHSPFGARINRAWGLALRKRFCRKFNFELQAAATDDALVLSLGTQHSFPLDEVFHYLNSKTVRDVLVQALLDAPMFTIRWRWNTTRALAVLRQKGGRKHPAPLQRMDAENLLAAVFPDQLACLENIAGDREIPDHPLVRQTIDDCLKEAMDIDGLEALLKAIETGDVQCLARDLPEPSPLAHEILNARPYAFLDNAPLEERRTQAVYTRRALDSSTNGDLGVLDAEAIERVVAEAWPTAATADELHDALLMIGAMTEEEVERTASNGRILVEELTRAHRTGRLRVHAEKGGTGVLPGPVNHSAVGESFCGEGQSSEGMGTREACPTFWLAAERLPMLRAIYSNAIVEPDLRPPDRELSRQWERTEAVRELIRGRLEVCGPVTACFLSEMLAVPRLAVDAALLALEAEGFILRGRFHPDAKELEWCDRRLLARIHRLTINRLRAEIQPVSISDFCRFLTAWQRLDVEHHAQGPDGLDVVLEQLDGYELPAAAWEPEVLAARVKDYDPQWLDRLCLTGRIGWGRLTPPQNYKSRPFAPLRSSPIALWQRESVAAWLALSPAELPREFSNDTQRVFDVLKDTGAVFFAELVRRTGLLPSVVEQALGELVAAGWSTADSFDGLRAMLIPSEKRQRFSSAEFNSTSWNRRHKSLTSVEFAGRWSVLRSAAFERPLEPAVEALASRWRGAVHQREKLTDETSALPGTALVFEGAIRERRFRNPIFERKGGEEKAVHPESTRETEIETLARVLLRRYGVVFRRLLEREPFTVSWYELGRFYRRLEARGEIRGGHFVSGVSGEQFALPDAIGLLRSVRKALPKGELITISGADPLNLVGILVPGPRIPATTANRVLLRDGVPIAAMEGGQVRGFDALNGESDLVVERALKVGNLPVALRPYYA